VIHCPGALGLSSELDPLLFRFFHYISSFCKVLEAPGNCSKPRIQLFSPAWMNKDKESLVDVEVWEQLIWLDVIEEKIWAPSEITDGAQPIFIKQLKFVKQYGKHVYGYLWRPINQTAFPTFFNLGWADFDLFVKNDIRLLCGVHYKIFCIQYLFFFLFRSSSCTSALPI
jgi:hypothetical protein